MKTPPMTMGTVIIFVVMIIIGSNAAAKTAADIFEMASQSVVAIHVYDERGKVGVGSGVVLSANEVVTNCHVIERAIRIKVHQSTNDYNASSRYSDRERDVCSLSVFGMKGQPVQSGNAETLKVGSRVYAIGTPQGLELTLSEGIISSLRHVIGGQLLQITTPISSGSSGGGLFDEEGKLVGLTTFYVSEGQQLNFAVPVEWVGELSSRHEKEAKITEDDHDWLGEALTLGRKKDWAGLITHSLHWTKLSPRDAEAWYNLGYAYTATKQSVEAIDAYRQAILINSEYLEAWYNLGVVCDDFGYLTEALKAYQQAVLIDQAYTNAWVNMAIVFNKLGQPDAAIGALREAVSTNPEHGEAWYNLGVVYGTSSQPAMAVKAFQQAVRINPEHAEALYNLGVAYGECGQGNQAMEVYERLKTLNPAKAKKLLDNGILP
jgi:tetratricopeptide (TPR) repeat protein